MDFCCLDCNSLIFLFYAYFALFFKYPETHPLFEIIFDKKLHYLYICVTLRIDIAKNVTESANLAGKWSSSDAPELFEELRLVGDLSAELLLSPEDQGKFLLTGTLSGTQRLTCARTLDPFDHPFETEIVVEVEKCNVGSQELDDEDDETFCLRIPVGQDYVDLTECIRQLVILQEPMYPVKNPDEDFHQPAPAPEDEAPAEDPRWAKLKALKRKMDESN